MKAASGALQTAMAAGTPEYVAELFTIALLNGSTLRLTTFDKDIVFGGHTFAANKLPSGPFVGRGTISNRIGTEVSQMDMTVIAQPSNQINSVPILQAIQLGYFDMATVTVQRVFMPTPGDVSLGAITAFLGQVADVKEVGRIKASLTVNSAMDILNTQLPRHTYQPGCRHTLFDAGCTLNPASFVQSGTISAGSNAKVLQTSLTPAGAVNPPTSAPSLSSASASVNIAAAVYYAVLTYVTASGETTASPESSLSITVNRLLHVASPPSVTGATGYNVYVGTAPGDGLLQNQTPIAIGTGWVEDVNGLRQGVPPPTTATNGTYALGVITFTSGANNGLSAWVQSNSGGTLTLATPLLFAPATSDAFTILPGCDLSMTTCQNKFGNLPHYGGEPFVPTPESGL